MHHITRVQYECLSINIETSNQMKEEFESHICPRIFLQARFKWRHAHGLNFGLNSITSKQVNQ